MIVKAYAAFLGHFTGESDGRDDPNDTPPRRTTFILHERRDVAVRVTKATFR
jgi:hypothetical protein